MITQAELKKTLSYDPSTGVFTWIIRPSQRIKANTVAGSENEQGYIVIKINGRMYKAHRLAWLYVNGYLPEHNVDHINRVRNDNRISNLREASQMCNVQNSCIRKDNTSGCRGVSWSKSCKKWWAYIDHKGERISLGYHETVDAARTAREKWIKENPDKWNCQTED